MNRIIANEKLDSCLFNNEGCSCEDCNKSVVYPYSLGAITEFCRSYFNNHQITFITNPDCNINCRHCFCPSAFPKLRNKPNNFISKEIIDKTFDIIGGRRVVVSILGGEVMLYPEVCKYIADKAHERGLTFRLITNGFFGNDEKLLKYVLEEIKPEITTISVDEYHQEFIPINIIKNLISTLYGYSEILIESCMDVKNENFNYDGDSRKIEIAKQLNLEQKKIFYLVDAIKKDGNAIINDLGYEKLQCTPGHCSNCGIVVGFTGKISLKCEFNSRPINDCKIWNTNIFDNKFDFDKMLDHVKTKRYWMNEFILNETQGMINSMKYIITPEHEQDYQDNWLGSNKPKSYEFYSM
jgi:MoaA/NifB/PqqE/SkfB family radical SAM enzyme